MNNSPIYGSGDSATAKAIQECVRGLTVLTQASVDAAKGNKPGEDLIRTVTSTTSDARTP